MVGTTIVGSGALCVGLMCASGTVGAGDCSPDWASGFGLGQQVLIQAFAVIEGEGGPTLYASGSGATVFQREVGGAWEALEGEGIVAEVRALAVFDDGGGPALYSTPEGGILPGGTVKGVVRWNGGEWENLGEGLGGTSLGLCLTTFNDGTGEALYVGGQFQSAGGAPATNIARWDGRAWSAVGSIDAGPIQELVGFDDGGGPALYVGGNTFTIDGETSNVARWDGEGWALLPDAPLGGVRALVVHDDGDGEALYAGGFGAPGSLPVVARFDGEAWAVVGDPLNGDVAALASFDDGSGAGAQLYAGGSFTQSLTDGTGLPRVARLEDGVWVAVGGGTSGGVSALAAVELPDGPGLLVGGFFATAGGMPSANVALWQGCATPTPCPADLDGSGGIDSGDLNIVLGGFGCSGGGCDGDVDGDGDVDSGDLNEVLGVFGEVCG